jgi:hypothetical protein
MAPPNAARPATPALAGSGPHETNRLGSTVDYVNNLLRGSGQLTDANGRVYREQVLRNWAPSAIVALGIRRVPEGGTS